uniref:CWH43-like N-terminal domain-containing protein n=1 Tax=Callorhinchus milii TaxID=7868 RepID=A0A4W3J7I8_CALMI
GQSHRAVSNLEDDYYYLCCFSSTCGAYPPQSCLFSQVMNIGANSSSFSLDCHLSAVTWVCVIRYQQIRDLGCHSHLNTVSLVTGCLSALGATLVGNFQIHVHLAGAFLSFFIGTLYFWLQVGLTYQVKPRHGGKWCGPVRIICCLACTASLASMLWLHVSGMRSAAAICEWVAGMVLLLLFGLFAVDFRHVDGHYFHVQRNPVREGERASERAPAGL